MTPSENPEAAGSNGTPASPPWQRVDKEGDSEATVKLATEDAQPPSGENPEQRPVVTGSAAPRLFGGAGDTPPGGETAVPPAATQRARPSALRRPGRGPRRASLQVKRFDPWSVLKLSLVLGVAMFFVWLVAVGVLYTVLDGMGVWDKLNGTYSSLVGGEGANASSEPLISAGRVFGIAAILGAINIVLVSALATVSAFIYNVSADLAGGLEVTLSERE
ncbi:DUF3566 domain-containing protein [Amycolatopsis australiensis]|uniref:DUF3566 domain-containing protein n=1 Tax=Amycolatopsis australiensis TaxID=546364 RepID=A0A1K1Q2K1_9PSEU|nr:DUF3566 domain-containing protein [Amycolatopsis australiensis]SFW53310.1 Transmembrane protein of unknown function [Amycolatopsis australiensis]